MSRQAQDGNDQEQRSAAEPRRLPHLSDRERDFWRRAVAEQRRELAAGAPLGPDGAALQ